MLVRDVCIYDFGVWRFCGFRILVMKDMCVKVTFVRQFGNNINCIV